QAQLSEVAVGDKVVIRGTCRGQPDGDVNLSNCSLVKKLAKPTLGPPVVVTAEALHSAYQENVVSADRQDKEKDLAGTGAVAKVTRNRPGKYTVELGKENQFVMLCDFLEADGKAQLGAVKTGAKVTVRGICRGNGEGILVLENCTLVKDEKKPKGKKSPE